MHAYNGVLTILGLACFWYLVFCVSVKVKLTVPEMTYTVSGGTLNPTYSLTHKATRLLIISAPV